MKPIGKVTHYYDKLGVMVIELHDTLRVGDRIRVEKDDDFFEQEVISIHKNYVPVQSAKEGDVIGLKVEHEVKDGALVLLS